MAQSFYRRRPLCTFNETPMFFGGWLIVIYTLFYTHPMGNNTYHP